MEEGRLSARMSLRCHLPSTLIVDAVVEDPRTPVEKKIVG